MTNYAHPTVVPANFETDSAARTDGGSRPVSRVSHNGGHMTVKVF